jgi:hypothetical protein
MKAKVMFALVGGMVFLLAVFALHHARPVPANHEPQQTDANQSLNPADPLPEPAFFERAPATNGTLISARPRAAWPATDSVIFTNKLEQLAHIREMFHALAAGDPTAALREAKQIPEGTERETALLTLATEWTHGDLHPPRERARNIEFLGLEAGLGMELVKNPELALLWANEMTEGQGRAALLQQTAVAMTESDPAAAFALSEQVPENERRKFFDAVFAGWAEKDTAAALQWADQLPESSERAAALQSIRSVAPVGIGAALRVENGYAVINQLLPGTPAELSGQLHAGDRILALAQGDNAFVDAHGVALKDIVDMIRGSPGTVLQMQVLSPDAPAGAQPQIVSITRDQLKFKR